MGQGPTSGWGGRRDHPSSIPALAAGWGSPCIPHGPPRSPPPPPWRCWPPRPHHTLPRVGDPGAGPAAQWVGRGRTGADPFPRPAFAGTPCPKVWLSPRGGDGGWIPIAVSQCPHCHGHGEGKPVSVGAGTPRDRVGTPGYPHGPVPCPGSGRKKNQTSAPLLVGPTVTPQGCTWGLAGWLPPYPTPYPGWEWEWEFGLFKCPQEQGYPLARQLARFLLRSSRDVPPALPANFGPVPPGCLRDETLEGRSRGTPTSWSWGTQGSRPRRAAGSGEGRVRGSGAGCGVQPCPEPP